VYGLNMGGDLGGLEVTVPATTFEVEDGRCLRPPGIWRKNFVIRNFHILRITYPIVIAFRAKEIWLEK